MKPLLRKSPSWFFCASLFAFLGCFLLYVQGFFAGKIMNPSDPEDLCPGIDLGYPPMRDSLFPLSSQCLDRDGTHTELVPYLTNPLIFFLIALVVIFFALGVYRLTGAKHHNPRSRLR